MDNARSFSHWLRQLRIDLDLTQEVLAERVGCSVESIRAFELGRRRPSRPMAERLADVLQIAAEQRTDFMRLARTSVPNSSAQPVDTSIEAPAARPPSQLPVPSTPLIGRAAEQATIGQRLSDPTTRILTIVGPGGSGKTRLALQVAADLMPQFADGVAFVNLAPVAAAAQVPAAIAGALGLALTGGAATNAALLVALRERSLLLVLDNLEHLLDAATLLTSIVQAAPGVRLLVTSRERLRLQGEQVIALDGLALPADDSNRAAVERADAVLLFLTRARQVAADFALTPANRVVIAQICRLLGGMPLAIELAASWLHVLAPEEIAAELTRDLDFLALSDRDSDPRHRSMRAVFDHSWRLLSAEQQAVFARLSVFAGGCTREAAQQIAGATLPVLASLIDKSLLRRTPTGRYELHELVRQFAAQQLAADPQAVADVHARHAEYYTGWIVEHGRLLKSPQQQAQIAAILAEIDNLRTTWHYAVDQRRSDLLWQMSQTSALLWFYELRSWYQEAQILSGRVVDMFHQRPPETHDERMLQATQTAQHGWFVFRCGNSALGIQLLEQAQTMLERGDQPLLLFFNLTQLSYLIYFNGEFDRAAALLNKALETVQKVDDPWARAFGFFQRAVLYAEHAPEIAYQRFHEGMPFIRAGGDSYHIITSLNHMGEVALTLGHEQEAAQIFNEALKQSMAVGNSVGEVAALNGLAQIACVRGDWREAIRSSMEANARSREVGDLWGRARVLVTLGAAEAGSGDLPAARRTFAEAIRASLAAQVLPTALDAAVGLAALDVQDAARRAQLLPLLALVRAHPATRTASCARALALWNELAAQHDAQVVADSERAAHSADAAQLLSAYIDGRGVLGALG